METTNDLLRRYLAKQDKLQETVDRHYQELRNLIDHNHTELKAEIAELRTEIAEVRAELKAEIAEVRADLNDMNTKLDARITSLEDWRSSMQH